jgi:hypothetical protein
MAEKKTVRLIVTIEAQAEVRADLSAAAIADAAIVVFEHLVDYDADGQGPFGSNEDDMSPIQITDTTNFRVEVR